MSAPPAYGLDEVKSFLRHLISSKSPLINSSWISHAYRINFEDESQFVDVLFDAAKSNPSFRSHPLFDARWYGRAAALGPEFSYFGCLKHYLEIGEKSGFSPSPFCPIDNYRQHLQRSGVWPGSNSPVLETFIQDDLNNPFASTLLHFDCRNYVEAGPRTYDERFARSVGLTPFCHYVAYGWIEGRRPNPVFDEEWYLLRNKHARDAVLGGIFPNGFSHYLMTGESEKLNPSPFFDPEIYVKLNPDLVKFNGSLFWHYWMSGRFERRRCSNSDVDSLVSAHFPFYFPDARDVVIGGDVIRCEDDHASTMERLRSRRAIDGASVTKILLDLPNTGTQNELLRAIFRQKACAFVRIDRDTKYTIFTRAKNCVYASGLAFLPFGKLLRIEAKVGDVVVECPFVRTPRLEYLSQIFWISDDKTCIESGFLCRIPFPELETAGDLYVPLVFVFENGGREDFHTESIVVSVDEKPAPIDCDKDYQIAMAAYNPGADDLETQIGSILNQTESAAVVISDDASAPASRMKLYAVSQNANVHVLNSDRNRGFVMNFERALRAVSPKAKVILLSDQDDKWRPTKLSELGACFEDSDVSCAFSDMHVVKADGTLISDTFWSNRQVHYSSPVALAIANAVTGAASAISPATLEKLLPFPQYRGLYHDHWLSVCCSALGRIAYIDKPLYDYRQHGGNVLGFFGSQSRDVGKWRMVADTLRRALKRHPRDWRAKELDCILECIGAEAALYQRYILLKEALERIETWRDPAEQALAAAICTAIAGGAGVDLKEMLRGWRRLQRRTGIDALIGHDLLMECLLTTLAIVRNSDPLIADLLRVRVKERDADAASHSEYWLDEKRTDFEKKIAPVKAHSVASRSKLSVTMLIPELNQQHFFGGYYSKIALAQRLIKKGVPVRLALLDQTAAFFPSVAQIASAFPELSYGLDNCEIVGLGDRKRSIGFAPNDAIVATTWWSAHVAEKLRSFLNRKRFVYLIQEYEPFTYALGTWHRAAEESYEFPYAPIFSTEMLRDFFKSACNGNFSRSKVSPARECLVFRNPIIARDAVARKSDRKRMALFYARPQAHAARNMYDFGVAALRKFAESLGSSANEWTFVGVGGDSAFELELTKNATLRMISKVGAGDYMALLSEAAIGLALMYTPHPSLVPLEMARAGVLTVTNSCMSKDASSFEAISDGVIVAEPSIGGISDALMKSARMFLDGAAPSFTDWPITIEQAFPDDWIENLCGLLEASLVTR